MCICLDGCLKALYRKRKLCYGYNYNQWKHETVHRKRRLSDKGLVVTSDGGLSSESVTNSPQKGESGTLPITLYDPDASVSGWSGGAHVYFHCSQ